MINDINVFYHYNSAEKIKLGSLSLIKGTTYFAYDKEYLAKGINLSPFKLEFHDKVQTSSNPRINFGLPGLFYDSLPDGWGLLLIKKHLESIEVDFSNMSGLDLLSYIGDRGMGALSYEPDNKASVTPILDLASFAEEAAKIQKGGTSQLLAELLSGGGSPGGARPKALIGFNEKEDEIIVGATNYPKGYRPWLVKFAGIDDSAQDAIFEHLILEHGKKANIRSEPSKLITDAKGNQWFATQRFDRGAHGERFHIHSLAGLFNLDFRQPNLDYGHLLNVTHNITKGSKEDVAQAVKLMTYNVLIGNRDDHVKNFSFLMKEGAWCLAPAYDITFNNAHNGSHTMTVKGKDKGITRRDIMDLAESYFTRKEAGSLIDEVLAVASCLKKEIKGLGIKKSLFEHIENMESALSHKN